MKNSADVVFETNLEHFRTWYTFFWLVSFFSCSDCHFDRLDPTRTQTLTPALTHADRHPDSSCKRGSRSRALLTL